MPKLDTKLTKHLQNLINGLETIYDCKCRYTLVCFVEQTAMTTMNCARIRISLLRLQEKFEFQARTNVGVAVSRTSTN